MPARSLPVRSMALRTVWASLTVSWPSTTTIPPGPWTRYEFTAMTVPSIRSIRGVMGHIESLTVHDNQYALSGACGGRDAQAARLRLSRRRAGQRRGRQVEARHPLLPAAAAAPDGGAAAPHPGDHAEDAHPAAARARSRRPGQPHRLRPGPAEGRLRRRASGTGPARRAAPGALPLAPALAL